MEVSNYLVSWVVTYLGDFQPTYIGVILYLLSTMDIPAEEPAFVETSRDYSSHGSRKCSDDPVVVQTHFLLPP